MTTILVVDDSLTERRLASSLLKQALDCSTTEVDSAEAALEYLASTEPDIVLTDLHMPGINGLQLVERIREVSSLPVILMTAKFEFVTFGLTQRKIDDPVRMKGALRPLTRQGRRSWNFVAAFGLCSNRSRFVSRDRVFRCGRR